jgi:hypothetical protein
VLQQVLVDEIVDGPLLVLLNGRNESIVVKVVVLLFFLLSRNV